MGCASGKSSEHKGNTSDLWNGKSNSPDYSSLSVQEAKKFLLSSEFNEYIVRNAPNNEKFIQKFLLQSPQVFSSSEMNEFCLECF